MFCLILAGVCAHLSCNSLDKTPTPAATTKSPGETILNQNSVNIEIFTIPVAPHQSELLHQLWQEVDEQSLPSELRRELLSQGFRAGILGNFLSPALAQLLNVSANAKGGTTSWGNYQEYSAADVTSAPTLSRNLRVLSSSMNALIKVYDDYSTLPELALFWNVDGHVSAQTYYDALGVFCISATPERDRTAQIKIIPELEHGFLEQQFRSVNGLLVQERGRPRRTFESLALTQRLLPGQWLILGATTPDSPGVGKAFFIRKSSVLEQRLLAIRLVESTLATPMNPAAASSKERKVVIPERN